MSATERGPIFFLTGAPGIGKSTVARALANRFKRAVHIDIDQIRLMVTKGLSLPGPWNMTEATTTQFELAHFSAGLQAKTYADAGFAVVAEHCSHVSYIEKFVPSAGSTTIVALTAEIEVNLYRNSLRSSGSFDYSSLDFIIPMLAEGFRQEFREAGIPIIETTNLTVEETVDLILKFHQR